jgi:hypothetical protein
LVRKLNFSKYKMEFEAVYNWVDGGNAVYHGISHFQIADYLSGEIESVEIDGGSIQNNIVEIDILLEDLEKKVDKVENQDMTYEAIVIPLEPSKAGFKYDLKKALQTIYI